MPATSPPPARTPPRLARWLLRHMLPAGIDGQSMLGDLIEEWHAAAASMPAAAARRKFWRATASLVWRYGLRSSRHRVLQHELRERFSPVDTLLGDLGGSVRSLRAAPTLSASVLATLALAIGAATAIFSIVDAVLIKPLPYQDPERLLYVQSTEPTGDTMGVSWPDYRDWEQRLTSFSGVSCVVRATFTLQSADGAERLDGRDISWSFLRVLGVPPAMGRDFTPEDDRAGSDAVIISDAFWHRRFGGDPHVIGRHLTLDHEPRTIIGVLPATYQFGASTDVFEPVSTLEGDGAFLDRGNHYGLAVVGRLRPGVTEDAARQELVALSRQLAAQYPNSDSGSGVRVQTLSERLVGDVQPTLVALLCGVGCFLLLACANIANLLVARGAARRHELAVRAALGGSRLRLAAQLLMESGVLASLGGALGLFTGWGLLRLLVAIAPPDTPRLDEVGMNLTVLGFALATSALAGVLFGVLPALHASRVNGQQALTRASRDGLTSSHRLRRGLMIVELALALVLLVGAGLMIQTMRRLAAVDPGFDASHLMTAQLSMPDEWTHEREQAVQRDLLDRVRALPGVTDAALTNSLPILGSTWGSIFTLDDRPVPPRANLPTAAFNPVTPNYFQTMGIALDRGRLFTDADRPEGPPVAVVNETFARRFWPAGGALGKRIKQGWPERDTPLVEIVGVVRDIKLEGVMETTPMQVYLSMSQHVTRMSYLVVRSAGAAGPDAATLEKAVHAVTPDVPLYGASTMDDVMRTSTATPRTSMVIFAVFAGLALLLAAIGLYGVVSHGVTERTREIGVRMALGADRARVLRLFVGQGALTAVVGVAIGVAGALVLARYLKTLLFGIEPTDAATFTIVAVALFLVALAACYLPARRATRVSPTVALRGE